MIIGIGGRVSSTGNGLIHVPFKYLDVAIDVIFTVIKEDIPTLLSIGDMLNNRLDVSIKRRYVSLIERRQPLTMENYFLIHQWSPEVVSYLLKKEHKLQTLQKYLGAPL